MATVGTVLDDDYRLVAPIGGGAMGTVWRAERLEDGEAVAIKILSEEHAQREELLERFEREAELAANVHDPRVCRVFGHGFTEEGTPYLAMELLSGESLGERFDDGPALSAAELVRLMIEALLGLEAVHAAGTVHRDLKPDNLYLVEGSGDARLKLIDFGVSKGSGGKQLTSTGELLGTPLYMAPEQAQSAKNAGPAADVYAIGAILYDGLAGGPPFGAQSTGMLLMAIAFEDPVPLGEVATDCPPALAAAVHRALEKEPEARFGSAAEMRAALEGVLDAHGDALAAWTPERDRAEPSVDGGGGASERSAPRARGSASGETTVELPAAGPSPVLVGALVLAVLVALGAAAWIAIGP